MKTTKKEIEGAVRTVAFWNNDRGHQLNKHDDVEGFAAAVDHGYLTPRRGSWGHRVTPLGHELLKAMNARREANDKEIRDAGFDPYKKVCDMTPEEVLRFSEWNHTR